MCHEPTSPSSFVMSASSREWRFKRKRLNVPKRKSLGPAELIYKVEAMNAVPLLQSDCKYFCPVARQNNFCNALESVKPWCFALKHVSPVCSERHVKPNCCQTAP